MKIGSLFSGYGGLDLGVQAVLGGAVAWHVEFDPAPSKILDYRFPGVPNYGDITKVDWSAVESVDVLTGGFPCQDVSLAGLRKGLRQGTRSGLWSEFAQAIGRLRPGLVVIENVRGLLSAVASGPLESDPWGLGDGSDGPSLRALGAVLGDLADLGYDAQWCGVRAADAGAPHGRFRVFIVANPAGQPWRVGDGDDVRTRGGTVGRASHPGGGAVEDTNLSARGDERWLAASDEAEGRWARPNAGGRGGASSPNSAGSGRDRWPQDEIGEAVGRVASTGRRGGTDSAPDARSGDERWGVVGIVVGAEGSREGYQAERERDGHPTTDRAAATRSWGQYTAAVERWESVLDRAAPSPTEPSGKGGAQRLSPRFVEWMMGLSEGWVTAPEIDLTRAHQLKALGNGVVPQQAELAVRTLLNSVKEFA